MRKWQRTIDTIIADYYDLQSPSEHISLAHDFVCESA